MFPSVPMAKLKNHAPAGSSSMLHPDSYQQTHTAVQLSCWSMHPKCPIQNGWRMLCISPQGKVCQVENPSHLISTLQRVFWAGTVLSWAVSPKQVSGAGCPQACGQAEIQHFGKRWMRISHPSKDGAGIGSESLI